MPPKEFPCLRCKRNVGKVKAVSCATCKQWVHKECEEMSDELYNVLAGKFGGGAMWQCQSCVASTARLEASIKQVETRLNSVEGRVVTVEEKSKQTDLRLDKVEMVVEQTKKAVAEAKEDVAKIVLEELREREDKKFNIILHSVGEAGAVPQEEAKKWDEDSFDNIMRAMEVNISYERNATFSRRLGAAGGEKARPLLVGLRREEDKIEILSNAKKLMKSGLRDVNVVPDLTRQQRDADENLRKEADRRNREELTEEDRSKNVKWVAVGRKGTRHLAKREVREYIPYTGRSYPNPSATLPVTQPVRKRKPQELDDNNSKKQRSGDGAEEEEEEEWAETAEIVEPTSQKA